MKKRLFLVILMLLVIMPFAGCRKKSDEDQIIWKRDEPLAVGLKIDTWETKGLLSIGEKDISFTHQSPASPLYGLTERVSEEGYESEYRGILWQSREVDLPMGSILQLIRFTEESHLWKKTQDSLGGIPVTKIETTENQNTVTVYLSEKSTPLRLLGTVDSQRIEINFSLEEEAFSFALA